MNKLNLFILKFIFKDKVRILYHDKKEKQRKNIFFYCFYFSYVACKS